MTTGSVKVLVEERKLGTIARVTIENAAKLNTLDSHLMIAFVGELEALAQRDDLRAVVLTGAGTKAFVGGANIFEMATLDAEHAEAFITLVHRSCNALRELPVPVIARVNGFCLGAGLEVAASCDMRAASDNARFGMPEVHMGLPSVIEAALLPGLIGWGRTREMLLTGELYSAADALAMGFVQKMVPAAELDAAVEHWIAAICRATPEAIRSQKALMNRWERVSVEEGVLAGIDALSDGYKTGEPQAAIKAFFDGKKTR